MFFYILIVRYQPIKNDIFNFERAFKRVLNNNVLLLHCLTTASYNCLKLGVFFIDVV